MLLVILMETKLLDGFTKKNSRKQIKNSLELKKLIKKKGNKLHVKWKGYGSYLDLAATTQDFILVQKFHLQVGLFGADMDSSVDIDNKNEMEKS